MNLKYKDGNSVVKHLSNFQGLLNELSTMKLVLDDEVYALILLSSLPDSWETLVVSLSNSAPNGVITVNRVKDNIFNEETRRKELAISYNTEALVIEKQGRSKNRKPSSNYNHEKSKESQNPEKRSSVFIVVSQGTLRETVENSKGNNLKEKVKNRKRTKTLQQLHLMVI